MNQYMICAKNPELTHEFLMERFPEIHSELTYDGVQNVLTVYLSTDLEYELLISYLVARNYY